ncbi:MAG: 1-deoxy-D-xylulose-5-phosphate reductoisomerase [Oscillospiraceae bacterium]|nr:1-deoxy-D-xylulose-5-phosphate reductoisomerase [Oscillospiraceae bacterium]
MKKVSILGSTGSIGLQALDVAKKHKLEVQAIAANSSYKVLEEQAREFSPEYVCIFDEKYYKELKNSLADTNVKVLSGMDGLCAISSDSKTDIILNSVVGMVGLLPTLTAIRSGKDVALANKETLVAGGNIVMSEALKNNVNIFPVDSEHSAIFQCLQGNSMNRIRKIILTASGGPFFKKTKSELEDVTVEQALAHPNWSMGNKITIDSSTLMNKGLEFIEAKWLFDLKPEQIEIVVHRQSVLHSAVEFEDFSVIGQMGVPDMRIPIQYALLYPQRTECPTKSLSLTDYGILTFEKPDYQTFDCLTTCIDAITKGGAYPCIVNAANEEAVGMFLKGKIKFLKIGELVKETMEHFSYREITSYDDVIAADNEAREFVRSKVF